MVQFTKKMEFSPKKVFVCLCVSLQALSAFATEQFSWDFRGTRKKNSNAVVVVGKHKRKKTRMSNSTRIKEFVACHLSFFFFF